MPGIGNFPSANEVLALEQRDVSSYRGGIAAERCRKREDRHRSPLNLLQYSHSSGGDYFEELCRILKGNG